MASFSQLGDPVCLCEHHGAAYAETPEGGTAASVSVLYDSFSGGATIIQVPITITKKCCIIVMTALLCNASATTTDFKIERPLYAARTKQEDSILSDSLKLMHHAAWEVLPAGTYTYFFVNRAGATRNALAAWIKAVASDCEG